MHMHRKGFELRLQFKALFIPTPALRVRSAQEAFSSQTSGKGLPFYRGRPFPK